MITMNQLQLQHHTINNHIRQTGMTLPHMNCMTPPPTNQITMIQPPINKTNTNPSQPKPRINHKRQSTPPTTTRRRKSTR